MRLLDSRRLTGPSLLLDVPGAILEVALHGVDPDRAIAAWREALAPLLERLQWGSAPVAARAHRDGASLAFGAPIDALYAATEVNEAAWHAAVERLGGGEAPRRHGMDSHDPDLEDPHGDADPAAGEDAVIERLREAIERERRPELLALAAETGRRGLTMLADDRRISAGLGRGSFAWPVEETAPVTPRLRWDELSDIPVALVTGTNGKTTTVRLLGAMARAAGWVAGVTSTDRVTVGDEVVAVGDFSGPNGARTVLRDRRVEVAFLELARGGILRRGLAVPRARAALVTNVANDHLGEFGIFDLAALADVKMVVAKAIDRSGRMVLNADDPLLLERGSGLEIPVIWFSLDARHPAIEAHLARGGEACLLEDGRLTVARGSERRPIATLDEIPIALGGAARHNVANALAALGVAMAVGLPEDAARAGLVAFENDPAANPGRANLWNLGGVTAIVDFAHNPHGLAALVELCLRLPARRRAIVIGQAGDRDDESIRELVRTAWAMRPDRVFVKEMESLRRGREAGEIPALIEGEFLRLGAARETITRCDSEFEAVRDALRWARPGDLLLLATHADRERVIHLIEALVARGWRPGQSLSEPAPA